MMMDLLTTVEVAALLGLKPGTLENWRIAGKGPPFRRLGGAIRYAVADVKAWVERQPLETTARHRKVEEAVLPGADLRHDPVPPAPARPEETA